MEEDDGGGGPGAEVALHQLPGHRHPRLLAQVQLGRGRAQASIGLLSRSWNSIVCRGYICLGLVQRGDYISDLPGNGRGAGRCHRDLKHGESVSVWTLHPCPHL